MKKFITLIIACITMLSCTACSLHHGNADWRQEQALDYVATYFGEAEVVTQEPQILDTTTFFKLKDKTDGFEYTLTAMEVYMSDLGFTQHAEAAGDKTIVFDNKFVDAYVQHVADTAVSAVKLAELRNTYPALAAIAPVSYQTNIASVFPVTLSHPALLMTEFNEDAVRAVAAEMKAADKRGFLNDYILPVYAATMENNQATLVLKDGDVTTLGYYDFYLDYIIKPEHYDSVTLAHDYLRARKIEAPRITSLDANVKIEDIKNRKAYKDGNFIFEPTKKETGTMMTITIDGEPYELFTELGVDKFDTKTNGYGVHEGSFLDYVATDRTGGAPVMISMYAVAHPTTYTSLALWFHKAADVADTEVAE